MNLMWVYKLARKVSGAMQYTIAEIIHAYHTNIRVHAKGLVFFHLPNYEHEQL